MAECPEFCGVDRGRQVVSTIWHFEVAVTMGKVAYMWY